MLVAAPTLAVSAQPAPARLSGAVTDATSGLPVRATVTVMPAGAAGGRPQRTDAAGRFVVGALPAGAVTVSAAAFGYRPRRLTVRLAAGADTAVTLAMAALPRVLEAVRTTAGRSAERAAFAGPAGASVSSVSRRELLVVPAVGEADALRVAALLPGVAARNDLWAGFNVRGGESDQTQVRLDGIPVFSPFHLGGLFSTFIPAAAGEVDARVGALPAAYGGRLSGVLDVASAEEARPGAHATLDLSAVSAAAAAGGALAAGRGSWNVAARRTYADALTSLVVRPGAFPYHFQDAQLHGAVLAPGGGTLALTAYAGGDLLAPAGGATLLGDSTLAFRFGWGNRAAGLAFMQPLGARAELVQRASYSGYSTRYDEADAGVRLANGIRELRLAGEVTRRAGARGPSGADSGAAAAHTLRAGYELLHYATRYGEHISGVSADESNVVFAVADTLVRQRSAAGVVYAEDLWAPSARLSVRPGVRLERVPAAGWSGVSPRLAVKYRPGANTALTFAAGRYAQWTHAVRNEDLPVRIVDVWLASDRQVPVSTGTELVAGAERWLSPGALVRVEGYAKRFADLVEPSSAVDPRLRPGELRRFGGTSRGVDVLARRLPAAGARLSGWVSYSLTRSRREFGAEEYYPAHDRRHDLNAVGSYRLSARYTFGARLGVAGGTPYTGFGGTYARWAYDPVTRRWRLPGAASTARNEPVRAPRNGERYPAYKRLDLSAHRAFRLGGAEGDAFVNVVNALNGRNVLLYAFDTGESPPRVRGLSQLPFLPTLGARVAF